MSELTAAHRLLLCCAKILGLAAKGDGNSGIVSCGPDMGEPVLIEVVGRGTSNRQGSVT